MNTPLYILVNEKEQVEQIKHRLAGAGLPAQAIQLLTLTQPEQEPVGSFAESDKYTHTPERNVQGSFAGSDRYTHIPERDHTGSFADSGPHPHTPQRDHVGSFAPHLHADDVLRDLAHAGVPGAEARQCVERMQYGAALLLVQADGSQRLAAQEILRSI